MFVVLTESKQVILFEIVLVGHSVSRYQTRVLVEFLASDFLYFLWIAFHLKYVPTSVKIFRFLLYRLGLKLSESDPSQRVVVRHIVSVVLYSVLGNLLHAPDAALTLLLT